jgi:hypothetical protein
MTQRYSCINAKQMHQKLKPAPWRVRIAAARIAIVPRTAVAETEARRCFEATQGAQIQNTSALDVQHPHVTERNYRSIPLEGQVARHASLRYPSRSKNNLFLLSAAQSSTNVFDLEACP